MKKSISNKNTTSVKRKTKEIIRVTGARLSTPTLNDNQIGSQPRVLNITQL